MSITPGFTTAGAPNACWQLDATEYVLAGGRKCVIFQLIDDHSRYAVASHAATGETSRDAIRVVRKAIRAHGVPQRLLTDNGVALNPSRRGILGQLVAYVSRLGVEPITGKPYKPTTQGKNERFHQDPVPLARQAAHRREPAGAAGANRPVRPHLQHRTPAPGSPRPDHPAGSVGSNPEDRPAETSARTATETDRAPAACTLPQTAAFTTGSAS